MIDYYLISGPLEAEQENLKLWRRRIEVSEGLNLIGHLAMELQLGKATIRLEESRATAAMGVHRRTSGGIRQRPSAGDFSYSQLFLFSILFCLLLVLWGCWCVSCNYYIVSVDLYAATVLIWDPSCFSKLLLILFLFPYFPSNQNPKRQILFFMSWKWYRSG